MVKVTTPISSADLPESVRALIDQREMARAQKDFARSDILRQEITGQGYLINDLPGTGGYELFRVGDESKKSARSYLVLFGSGENAPGSVDVYRRLFLTLGKRDLKIVLITTPAGFQPNVAAVYEEIRDFLLQSLPDFNLDIKIIFANTHKEADDPDLIEPVEGADIIFTGPGSPTYAAKHLKGTALIDKIGRRVKDGATLILASAATIAFSRHALPVYEIYKVGEDLHWQEGLDFYDTVWQRATIIPHFNNKEGGKNLDTTYCYMGAERFARLHKLLPANEWILGIDEHTAYIVDLDTQKGETKGKGGVRTL